MGGPAIELDPLFDSKFYFYTGEAVKRPRNIYGADVSTYAQKAAPKPRKPKPLPELGREELVKITKDHLATAKPIYGIVGAAGQIYNRSNTACHASIFETRDGGGAASEYRVAFSRLGGIGMPANIFKGTPAQMAYLGWILGPDSPWRSLVKDDNNDLDFAAQHGVIVADLDSVPANAVYNFFICTRFPTEYVKVCEWWHSLVQRGVTPALAFAATAHGGPRVYTGGHGGLNDRVNPKALHTGEPCGVLAQPITKGGRWTPASAIWDMAGDWTPAKSQSIQDKGWGPIQVIELEPDLDKLAAYLIEEQERLGLV